jgi:hypothetical protein
MKRALERLERDGKGILLLRDIQPANEARQPERSAIPDDRANLDCA